MSSPAFRSSEDDTSQRSRTIASLLNKPQIHIALHDQQGTARKTYSTMDEIRGTVSITAPSSTRFDELEIAFFGYTKTFVDRMANTAAISGRTEAAHSFMKLTQPGLEDHYPQSRILEAGQPYRFEFTFNVPSQLLPKKCTHPVATIGVRESHLRLPPSLGDKDLNAASSAPLDDLSPDMGKITYEIRATIVRVNERDQSESVVATKPRKIRVVPAVAEDPPVSLEANLTDYRFREEKNIKKNIFKGKLGRLVMESVEPRPFRLSSPSNGDNGLVDTLATVMLRFDPHDASSPLPRLSTLTSKLKSYTHYASSVRHAYPTKASVMIDMSQGLHTETLTLASRCVHQVEWETHASTPPGRRSSTNWLPPPSSSYNASYPFYTASIIVPLTLPANKAFVPNFHSCLMSRVYALDFSLSLHGPGPSSPTINVKVPIQVACAGSTAEQQRAASAQAAADDAVALGEELQSLYRPQSIATAISGPSSTAAVEGEGNTTAPLRGSDEPPSYQVFAPPYHQQNYHVSCVG
ncbi:MAG: hypothetical protein M1820_003164 [Bogoriella megaspora]|nr:MAG: hypothetical protein M1820_003164 [Bogoriella megaspora]